MPQITPGWDYRPKRPSRSPAVCDGQSAETSQLLTPEPFGIDNNVWSNDNSLETTAPSFINGGLNAEELMSKVLSETTDPVCTTTAVNHAAVSGYDQSPIDNPTAIPE